MAAAPVGRAAALDLASKSRDARPQQRQDNPNQRGPRLGDGSCSSFSTRSCQDDFVSTANICSAFPFPSR